VQPPSLPSRLTDQRVPVPLVIAYRKLSDLALVNRARSGDGLALDALVERHAPRVQRLAAQLMGDFEDARDAAQESLVKLCTRLRQFRGESQFATWLHRLVVNTCRDVQARKLARPAEPLELENEPAGEESDPTHATMVHDLRRELVDALSRLSADQRAVVVLRDAFDLSYEEIARLARMPVGTAKCYVHRGRERLRAGLEKHPVEETVLPATGPPARSSAGHA
jgi:RNA polymerase sigma-70 factor (ECF subfamily)